MHTIGKSFFVKNLISLSSSYILCGSIFIFITFARMGEQKIINSALRYVLDLLDPINHYPYHNINHTLDVYARV